MASESLVNRVLPLLVCPRGDNGCAACRAVAEKIIALVRKHDDEANGDNGPHWLFAHLYDENGNLKEITYVPRKTY